MKKRNSLLDVMKGIGILLVVIGHVSSNSILNRWIYSFHMPLFFFISGILYFLSTKVDSKTFLRKKFQGLLIPYFIFSLITFLYWVVIERHLRGDMNISIGHQILEMFISQGGDINHQYNVVLWFLPCLFMMELTFDCIYKNFKNHKSLFGLMILFSIAGYLLIKFCEFRLPFSIDTMCVSILFYGLGFIVAPFIDTISLVFNKHKIISILVFIILSVIISITYQGCNLNNNYYSNYVLFYIFGIIGILFMICLATLFKENKLLLFLGRNTLVLMCIHEPLKRIMIIIVSKISKIPTELLRGNIFGILFITAILMMVMYPIIIIINQYFPFMLGKPYKRIKKEV